MSVKEKETKLILVSFIEDADVVPEVSYPYIYQVTDNKPIDLNSFKDYIVEDFGCEENQVEVSIMAPSAVDLAFWRDVVKQNHDLVALKHEFVDTMIQAWDDTLDEHYWKQPEGDIDSVGRMDWEGMWAFAKASLIKEMEDHTQEQVEAEIRQAGFDFLLNDFWEKKNNDV